MWYPAHMIAAVYYALKMYMCLVTGHHGGIANIELVTASYIQALQQLANSEGKLVFCFAMNARCWSLCRAIAAFETAVSLSICVHSAGQIHHAHNWSDEDTVQAETVAKVVPNAPRAKAKRKPQPMAARKKHKK